MTLYAIDQSAGLIAVDQVTGVVSVSSSNVVQSVTTIRANEVFTVTVNQYSNISAASIGGHACTNIIEIDATTFSCVAPRSANYFGDNDLIFTDSTGACPAFSVSVLPETGYAAVLIATPPVWAPELITGNQYIYQPTQSYAGETSTVTVNSDGTISTTSGIVEGFPVVGYKIDHLSNYLAGNEVTYTLGVNDAPILDSSIPDQNFDAGDNVSIDFNAFFSDSDINDEITVSLSVTPSGLTLNNGVLTGIAQSFSQANIIATATDKAGNTQSDTFSFAVASLGSDSTPDQFSLGDAIFNAQAGSAQERSVTVTGIDTDANISVSAGAEYRINSSAYTSAQGTVSNGDTVTVRVIASSIVGGQVSASLNIGGVTDSFSVFTFTDAQPDQFSLGADVLDAQPSSIVDRAFTISGLSGTDRALISSTNATFSLDGSPFVSGPVSVGNGVNVVFRVVASSLPNESIAAVLTINETTDSLVVSTQQPQDYKVRRSRFIAVKNSAGHAPMLDEYFDPDDIDTFWVSWGAHIGNAEITSSEWLTPDGWIIEGSATNLTFNDMFGNEMTKSNRVRLSTTHADGVHLIVNRKTDDAGNREDRGFYIRVSNNI